MRSVVARVVALVFNPERACLVWAAIAFAIVASFIVFASSALGHVARKGVFDVAVFLEEGGGLYEEVCRTGFPRQVESPWLAHVAGNSLEGHPLFGCRVLVVVDGVGFPMVRRVVYCPQRGR